MCGIAGFILPDGAWPDPAELERMGGALAHRGPDDRGIHIAGPVGLAQTRLSIIGLATGHQPLVSEDGRLALVANGEVYNYLELNAELRAQGRRFRTDSDSETILQAYAVRGLAFLDDLRGMYAFALHDADAGRLILGRDRLGIKPLFYVRLPDRIAFASEIKALLHLLPQGPQVSAVALRQFLQNQFATGEETMITGIRRVLPGEALIIDAGLLGAAPPLLVRPGCGPAGLGGGRGPGGARSAHGPGDAGAHALGRPLRASSSPAGPTRPSWRSGSRPWGPDPSRPSPSATRVRRGRTSWTRRRASPPTSGLAHHQALRLTLPQVFGRIPQTIWAADELMRDYASLPTSILAETAGSSLKVVFSGEGGTRSSPATGVTVRASPSAGSRPCAIPGAGDFAPGPNGPPGGPGACSVPPCGPSRCLIGGPSPRPGAPRRAVGQTSSGVSTWTWSPPCRTTCWSRPTAC